MSDPRDIHEELARRLLAEDSRSAGSGTAAQRAIETDFAGLLEHERATEGRLRRLAVGSWGAVLACVPLLGVAFFIVRNGGGTMVEITRAAVIVIGILAILALFLAVLSTVAWLFRPRAASLAAIERRLAAIERLLVRSAYD